MKRIPNTVLRPHLDDCVTVITLLGWLGSRVSLWTLESVKLPLIIQIQAIKNNTIGLTIDQLSLYPTQSNGM